jgi:hypothetical protein
VANYISIYIKCQKVKTKHRHPARLLQPLSIPKWKWEIVTVDFITKPLRIVKQHDSTMVVVDKFIKVAHFIPVKTTHKATNIAEIYMKEVASIHGVPKAIVSDRDPKFTSNFWKGLFNGFGTNINFNTTCHPDSDGKTERTSKIIEDMLKMYVMDFLSTKLH